MFKLIPQKCTYDFKEGEEVYYKIREGVEIFCQVVRVTDKRVVIRPIITPGSTTVRAHRTVIHTNLRHKP